MPAGVALENGEGINCLDDKVLRRSVAVKGPDQRRGSGEGGRMVGG